MKDFDLEIKAYYLAMQLLSNIGKSCSDNDKSIFKAYKSSKNCSEHFPDVDMETFKELMRLSQAKIAELNFLKLEHENEIHAECGDGVVAILTKTDKWHREIRNPSKVPLTTSARICGFFVL